MVLPSMKTVVLRTGGLEDDYAAFKERTDKIVDQFEGLDSYGAKVNGKLTVSENVADLGGVACALEAAKRDEDFRFENSLSTLRRFGVRRHVKNICKCWLAWMFMPQLNGVPMLS